VKDIRLTIAIATQGDAPSLLLTRNDNDVLNTINLELANLESLGKLGARAMVGEYALMMLQQAHPEDFKPYPALEPEHTEMHSPVDFVNYMIEQTKLRKTRRLIPAIDAALEMYKNDLKHTAIPQQWPTFKAAFERLYTD
jgi:hypothetical protein